MKKQIRFILFETNSSSVHTLQISNNNMTVSELNIEDDGYVHVVLDQYYGKDPIDYDTQLDKLKYICTWLYIFYGCDLEKMYDSSGWNDFIYEFTRYINETNYQNQKKCLGIKVILTDKKEAWEFLDHQSQPYGVWDDSNCVVDLWNSEQLVNFIFNPYIWLHTDCD